MPHAPSIRRARATDAPAILRIFDEVIAWFVEIGNEEQWGSEPWSTQDRQIARVTEACELPEAWVAVDQHDEVLGFIALGSAMPYVPKVNHEELYVRVLIASRAQAARGVGRRLMELADERALAAGISELRLDCFAGGSGGLVRFYESCGYERDTGFTDDGWPGQILVRSLTQSAPHPAPQSELSSTND